jgi:hypothetical protein
MLSGSSSHREGDYGADVDKLPNLPKKNPLGDKTQSKDGGTSEMKTTSQLVSMVAVMTSRPSLVSSPMKAFEMSEEKPVESLKKAVRESNAPLILVSLSGRAELEVVAHHVKLIEAYGDLFAAVGLGSQDQLQFVKENGVLWIVRHQTPRVSQCSVVDLLESDFIIKREVLAELVAQTTSDKSLIEIFYKLHKSRRPVVSCSATQGSQTSGKSPFIDYGKVEWQFQLAHDIKDVIDERTDAYSRVHDQGNLFYCNTTYSKRWNETYGKQPGKLTNARKTLFDWRLVLDELGYPLKISSGTLLGWMRQCDFIPYTSDIDTTLPIYLYTEKLFESAERHGFKMLRKFGKPSLDDETGGWEITFQHKETKNDLDVFFSYQDIDGKDWTSLWIGGNTLNRVYFARDILMDTMEADFLGIRVTIPKDPVLYLFSSYGAEWEVPKSKWTWWNSVHNQFKPPFPRWPAVTNITTHPLVDQWRAEKIVQIREQNIRKGLIKP